MSEESETILLVESDPDITELIANQALRPLGYRVQLKEDVSAAISQAAKETPDLVIVDLNLTGLSGKDLLVAFNSLELQVPVIVIAEKGQENKVIQAFRLGGTDYLLWPAREMEVISAVERALKQVREHRLRQQLDIELKETNEELERSVRELKTILAIGKAVTSISDQRTLFKKIVEGMVYVADADYGWLLLRDERRRDFKLSAHQNLPEIWSKKLGQTLDDGISSLVALSGETLAINGEPMKRFILSSLGSAALAVPVKIHREIIGMLVVVRKSDRAFEAAVRPLLEAVADYTSLSIVNARLFRALQENAETMKAGDKKRTDKLLEMLHEVQLVLKSATYPIEFLLSGSLGSLSKEQLEALRMAQASLHRAVKLAGPARQSLTDLVPQVNNG